MWPIFAYILRSRANLSTVKLQMQRLNCHSQLISNFLQQNAHGIIDLSSSILCSACNESKMQRRKK